MARISTWARRAAFLATAAGLLLLPLSPAEASGIGRARLLVEFTKPDAAREVARWSLPDRIRCGAAGLAWDGLANASYDVSIEITRPLAIGTSWWAATNASIGVTLDWQGPAANGIFGHLHMRHSPDAKHWSDWQELPRHERANGKATHTHLLSVNTPRPAAEAWNALVRRYLATEPEPRARTQAAAAAWAERHHPGYLAGAKPFFGYMQFRYDVGFPGQHRLRSMDIAVNFVIPGPAHPPEVPGADAAALWREPWNYVATGARRPEAAAACESATREVLGAALSTLAATAAGGGPDGTGDVLALTLCDRTAPGRDLLDLAQGGALPPDSPFGPATSPVWSDFLQRNGEAHLVLAGIEAGKTLVCAARYHGLYLQGGGRRGPDTPAFAWQRFHGHQPGSLGFVWVAEPGLSLDGTQAIAHVSRAYGVAAGYGAFYLLTRKDGAWSVTREVRSWGS